MTRIKNIRVNERLRTAPIAVTWPNWPHGPSVKEYPFDRDTTTVRYLDGESFYQESLQGDKIHPTAYYYKLGRRSDARRAERFVLKNENFWTEYYRESNEPISFDVNLFDGEADLKALKQLYNRITDSDFNLAQALLVEGKDSVKLLRNAFSKFGVLDAATKKLLRTDPKKLVANTWLEYSLGWRPLANDLYNLVLLLGKHPAVVGDKFNVTGSGKDRTRISETIDWYSSLTEKEHKVRYKVKYKIKNIDIFRQRQSGILNPINLLWQYTNLSFVVDWFYDVSGLLQTLEGAIGAGLEFESGQKAELHRNSRRVYGDTSYKRDYKRWSSSSSGLWPVSLIIDGTSEYIEFRRSVLNGFPVPSLPKFDIGGVDGSAKAATAASLISQALSHGKR